MRLVVQYHLFGFLLVVLVVTAIPIAESGQAHEFRTPRQLNVQFAQLCRIATTHKQVHVASVCVDFVTVVLLFVGCVAFLGQNHARVVRQSKHFGGFVKCRKFATVTQKFVYVCNFSVHKQLGTDKTFRLGRHKNSHVVVGDICAVGLHGNACVHAVKRTFACHKQCVLVAKNTFFAYFQAHDVVAQKLHSDVVLNVSLHKKFLRLYWSFAVTTTTMQQSATLPPSQGFRQTSFVVAVARNRCVVTTQSYQKLAF